MTLDLEAKVALLTGAGTFTPARIGPDGIRLSATGPVAPVTVTDDSRILRVWNTTGGVWERASGGELLIARGLGDIRATL